jgi:hypothetical protein
MVWRPLGGFGGISRLQRLEIACGITLSLLLVSAIKHYSQTSCPWDLQAFGGTAHYVSHWAWGLQDGGSGRCFPGGHASAALAYLALPLPWLLSPVSAQHKLGQRDFTGDCAGRACCWVRHKPCVVPITQATPFGLVCYAG